ncbi:unnamed protein product [Sphagnum compactum]
MVLPVVGRPLTQVALSEGRRNWPFVFGFAFTLGLVIKLSTSLNPKDAQKSTFVNPNAHRYGLGALLFQGFLLSSNLDHMKVAYGEHDELELHSCPWIHQWTLLAVEIGVQQVIFELGWPSSLPKNGVT